MPEGNENPRQQISWVVFPDNSAVLRRMIFPDGRRGLLLQFTKRPRHRVIRQNALRFGFLKSKRDNSVYMEVPEGRATFSARQLADALGGICIQLLKDKIYSYPWTVDFSAPDLGHPHKEHTSPDPATMTPLGRNHEGDEVYQDRTGQRFRKSVSDEGKVQFAAESDGEHHTVFLRAKSTDDLASIAAGLIFSAERGTITRAEFEKVLQVCCAGQDGSKPSVEIKSASKAIRDHLVRQLMDIVTSDGGSRANYHRAVRIGTHLAGIIDPDPDPGGAFIPTTGFLIFLKRLTRELTEIEFSGSDQLAYAVPNLRSDGVVSHQLYDLLRVAASSLSERALNILAGRCEVGWTILIVSGNASSSSVDALKHTVGRSFTLEIVAEFAPHLATGHHGDAPVSVLIIGEKRPSIEDSLPQAARRIFSVMLQNDLDGLYREIIRSRKQIKEWMLAPDEELSDVESGLEDNFRQRPYIPLSRISSPFTMIAKSLEGATASALTRVSRHFERRGGVDSAVANTLGLSKSELEKTLIAEQVDAVAMCEVARARNRAFLLADQTGVGKGRSLAAIARQHIRQGGRVLYFTENAEINIPDVWRDLTSVHAIDEVQPVILASRPIKLTSKPSNTTGEVNGTESRKFRTLTAAKRNELFKSGAWPEGCNLILTNYAQFRGGKNSVSRSWSEAALGTDTLLVLDESQNAINPASNTGSAIRTMIEAVGRANVVYATATPMRDQLSANLYLPLLPDAEGNRLRSVLSHQIAGGETAQESFTTMLAEDGVFLRRDHDLSNIDFQVRLPDDKRIAWYQDIMDRFSPLVEKILDCSLRIGGLVGDTQGRMYLELIDEGLDEATARAQSNALYQYSSSPGSALARLASLMINAIKIEQIVQETISEIREGRKPLITFHSTGAELFKEMVESGEAAVEGQQVDLDLSHQIRRVAHSIFKVRTNNSVIDAREAYPEITPLGKLIDELINDLPSDLPASPLDALKESLQGEGVTVGEISGRQLCYRSGRILRRRAGNRREIVDSFNEGSTDVLIYNMAGATGGSYHAAPEFKDQRPRTLIEMETPIDIIKYVQAQGRGNRYGQVVKPRIVSAMTGLIPEMRILQQRNRKLRAMGASVDGNRSHPLLLDDIPDFLNRIGDQSARQVLESNQDMARRLGFWSMLRDLDVEEREFLNASPASGALRSTTQSIANKVLTRSIVLSAEEQSRLIELIRLEFDAIVEELESRNENPLRPKELHGEIEIRAKTLYSGVEAEQSDLDISAFFSPLYISTGIHRYTEEPISGEELQSMVSRARITDGTDGFAPFAESLRLNLSNHLRHLMRPGTGFAEAMENLEDQPARFVRQYNRLDRLIHLLGNIKPGKVIQFDVDGMGRDLSLRTIVKLTAPEERYRHLPQAYKIRTVSPGSAYPEIISLNRLVNLESSRVRFGVGLELKDNQRHLREFSRQSRIERSYPVQILTGNHLAALDVARRYKLGSMTLYRDGAGQMNRGIIVTKDKLDLQRLPVIVPSGRIAAALVCLLARNELECEGKVAEGFVLWSGDRDRPEVNIRFHRSRFKKSVIGYCSFPRAKLSKAGREDGNRALTGFYEGREELYEVASRHRWYSPALDLRTQRSSILQVCRNLEGLNLFTDSVHRNTLNELNKLFDKGEIQEELDLEHAQLSGFAD